ncbi:PVC-type heme-binding CxxCH protein [Prosthecobacter vanneervenii]|uniref:Putative membrane-bound dehydrogenase-like protein n=1 Tax=Prosthecobacter vanneervenii TaxID=48466 RepID=A0A7W8DLE4_9BACT|nr:PVC-type heme-binding CxxCH protein [Prosthecobacter vanneervenii]MBB5033965.1 putative membrane-bound dehydrogenase-like protein [Prosthecobacter vanneervenii]
MKLLCALLLVAPLLHAESIFDGNTLAHWSGKAEHWRVEDRAITGEIPSGQQLKSNEWIFWDGEVHDFDLTVEFRITGGPSANSGIQYRCQQSPDGHASGYQADLDQGAVWLGRIYDEHGRALLVERGSRVSIAPDGRRWADVFAEPKSLTSVIKAGDWNKYQITATASHVEVRVNDILMSVLDDHEAKTAEWSGKIAFQLHSGPGPAKVQFRNIQLTHLGKTTMPLRSDAGTPARNLSTTDVPSIPPPTELNLGFETGTLAGWKAEGDAWEKQPVEGDTVAIRKRGNSQHAGKFWLGGYERSGDKGTGTLTSASFVATHPWASFLLGAAPDANTERVEIIEEATGKIIQSSSAAQQENMKRVAVNLEAVVGKRIFIRIVDQSKSGWGHVNFDDFVFHAQKPTFAVASFSVSSDRNKRGDESPVLWHLLPNTAKPSPVKNEAAQKLVAGMKLQDGFQVELIAAEPDVRQPIAFCFDERGRMWVAEAFSYPNRQPEGQGKDRISIFEDTDGDGSFETKKVFCEGLNLVSGIEVGFGGVWVGAAPYLLFIPRNGDKTLPSNRAIPGPSGSVAQVPSLPFTAHILLDGWGYQDTHETLNSFTWGPDGWLYGNQGVFTQSHIGKPGTPDDKRTTLNAGVWRYHPVRHVFEIFCSGGSNQWGLDYNSNGHFFMTHCRSFWGKGGTTHAIRNGHFWNQANSKYAPFISATAPDFAPDLQNYLPASARYDSGEGGAGKPGTTAVYGGHSHVGTIIYNGDNWPAIYRDHLFTHNLHGHQINQQHMVRTGSGYETFHAGYDLLYSPAPDYIPVDLQTGPDGAVYVIDWTDTQHCHNPEDEKWDRSNGRIYRISWKETYKPVKVDLERMSGSQLVELQLIGTDWEARMARKRLQETPAADVTKIYDLEYKGDLFWLRALWTLASQNQFDAPIAQQGVEHPNDIVRSWAIQLATEEAGKPKLSATTLLKLAQTDPSPTVRLALASALPNLAPQTVWEVSSALAMHAEDKDDRFLPKMIWFGLARVIAEDWPRGLALAAKTPLPSLADSIRWYAATTPAGREALIPTIQTERDLKILAFGMKDEAKAAMPKAWPQLQAKFPGATADQLSALFGDKTVLAKMRGILADASQPLPQRRSAFDLLKRVSDPEATPIFATLLDHPDFTSAVIPLLSRSSDPVTATALISRFPKLNDTDRAAALGTLTSRAELAQPLLAAVKAGTFDKKYLSSLQIRQMRSLNNTEINSLLDVTWGKVNESNEAAKASIAKLKKAYQSAPLWAFNAKSGEETFKQVCAICHAMGGVGGKLGPDLAGSWRNGLDYFLENIIDPNAVVGDNFQLHVLTKKDGSVVSGVIEQETATAITARTVTDSVIISKADLKSRQKMPVSLMPPGLLESMPERKALELLKYLLSKRD